MIVKPGKIVNGPDNQIFVIISVNNSFNKFDGLLQLINLKRCNKFGKLIAGFEYRITLNFFLANFTEFQDN